MDNIKINKAAINTAKIFSELSYANREKVGSVLMRDKRILACGYNGTPPGMPNICEDIDNNTNIYVVHSEANLICFCAKNGISTNNTTLYVTLSPCIECAKLIAASGIDSVLYLKKYRNDDGIKLLHTMNIVCKQINIKGEVHE